MQEHIFKISTSLKHQSNFILYLYFIDCNVIQNASHIEIIEKKELRRSHNVVFLQSMCHERYKITSKNVRNEMVAESNHQVSLIQSSGTLSGVCSVSSLLLFPFN